MVEQFEAAGVAAIPAMREVLKQHEIPSLNRSERRIRRIGGQVASTQIEATESKHLEHLLQRLPRRLAHELAQELKHLHIDVNLHEHDRKQGKKIRQHHG
jgi:hypothetical protein